MKKTILLMAALTLGLTSCTKDNDDDDVIFITEPAPTNFNEAHAGSYTTNTAIGVLGVKIGEDENDFKVFRSADGVNFVSVEEILGGTVTTVATNTTISFVAATVVNTEKLVAALPAELIAQVPAAVLASLPPALTIVSELSADSSSGDTVITYKETIPLGNIELLNLLGVEFVGVLNKVDDFNVVSLGSSKRVVKFINL